MIYIERTVIVENSEAYIDEAIYLYRGDKNIEIRLDIENNPFKYKNDLTYNYAQLIIERDSAPNLFSEVTKVSSGKVIFTVTESMIDELAELGGYTFQIRLFNDDMSSRGTLPPVEDGIIIREPLFDEQPIVNETRAIGSSEPLEIFDENGDYIKTIWVHGDIITDTRLNKIEGALYEINEKDGANIDLTGYATEEYVDSAIETIELTPGPKGEQGEVGPMGPQGPQGDKGEQGETGPAGADGKDGADFTYDMFTTEQLEALRGPQGEPGKDGVNGEQGPKGDKGDPGQDGTDFTYDMFTPEQLEALRGPSGKDGVDGATGLQGEKGDKGDKGDTGADGKDFTYDMFTPEQLEALRGPQGEPGPAGQDGKDGEQGIQGERGEKGDKGDQGDKGDKGDKGDPGETPSLEGYATITYVDNMLGNIESLLGGI